MELRVLKYFLMVAREENITKAAELLHITQPTLSRQLMQLEEELGVTLFKRSKHSIILTDDGILLKRRAQELVALSDKVVSELSHRDDISGEISIGCGETQSMNFLSERIAEFQKKYPSVQVEIFTATADDIKERIEKGILDMGLLTEPVDIGKYEFIRMPNKERWGLLMRKDSHLADKSGISPDDLTDTPLIMVRRELVRNELASWFGEHYDSLDVVASYNLILNAAAMVRSGVGLALCFDMGAQLYDELCFVPLVPKLETGSVMVWKKNQIQSGAVSEFIRFTRNAI